MFPLLYSDRHQCMRHERFGLKKVGGAAVNYGA